MLCKQHTRQQGSSRLLCMPCPMGCCRALGAGIGLTPPSHLATAPAPCCWAAASENHCFSNWTPLRKGRFFPARHLLPLPFADWCPCYSCALSTGGTRLYAISIGDCCCSILHFPRETSRLCRFPRCLLSSLEHQRVRRREREGEKGEKVLCCVDYCVFVIWNGVSCRYSISQR